MKMFDNDFINALKNTLQDRCADGSCLTAAALTQAVGLEDSDKLFVSRAVKTQLSDMVGVQAGPDGGFHLLAVPLKKPAPKAPVEHVVTDEFVAAVREEVKVALGKGARGISSSYLSGRLSGQYPECFSNHKLIGVAVGKLPEFTVSKGIGIHARPAPAANPEA